MKECNECNMIKEEMNQKLQVCLECIHNHWLKVVWPNGRKEKTSGSAENAKLPGQNGRDGSQRFPVTVTYADGSKT